MNTNCAKPNGINNLRGRVAWTRVFMVSPSLEVPGSIPGKCLLCILVSKQRCDIL